MFRTVTSSILALALLLSYSGAAQHPELPSWLKPQTAPGKHLRDICTIVGTNLECQSATKPAPKNKGKKPEPQTITVRVIPGGTDPFLVGMAFRITASSTSGLPVSVAAVDSDAAVVRATADTFVVVPRAAGTIVLQADQTGDTTYAKATPVRVTIRVINADDVSCAALFPTAPVIAPFSGESSVDAATVVSLMGDPKPFSLAAQGSKTILIYSANVNSPGLVEIRKRIANLVRNGPGNLGLTSTSSFSIELSIPHASALGDFATKINNLGFQQFKAQSISSDKVRITSPNQPDCKLWTAFLKDVRILAWQITPEQPTTKLFFLSASDVSTALGGSGGASGGPSGGSGPGGNTSGTGPAANQQSSSQAPPSGSPANAGNSAGANSAPAQAGTNTTTVTITQPAGAATYTNLASATATSNNTGASTSPSSINMNAGNQGGTSNQNAPPPGGGTAPAAKAGASVAPLSPDWLLFSDPNPGDDGGIVEKKRLLALLDLPRPEMIINAWVMQNSSNDAATVGKFSQIVRETVNRYNAELQETIVHGWTYLKQQMASDQNFFDPTFRRYVTGRYVADLFPDSQNQSADEAAQNILNSQAGFSLAAARRQNFGICRTEEYCLGYYNLFQPLQPRLTDLLIAIIASKDPAATTKALLKQMESLPGASTASLGVRDAIFKKLQPPNIQESDCQWQDLRDIKGDLRMRFNCFGQLAELLFGGAGSATDAPQASGAGLMRAAIADFLFNYKISQQYPHEFVPYDLSQSAQTLNSALAPLIDAFNQDLTAYQIYLRAELDHETSTINACHNFGQCLARGFGLYKPSFLNDGIVTVRTISGKETIVDAVSQSFIDVSTAPTLSDLVSDITGQKPPGGTSHLSNTLAPNILNNLSFNEAQVLLGSLQAFQSSKAQIGRELKIDITPRSLAGASSAELDVTLNADDAGNPAFFSGPKSGNQLDLSRVAKHDTQTKVRVESIKFFEVSSFSAVLQRSRSRFPIIPPGIELPYIGTLAGFPLPTAKEYHTSTAILSAIVVPTAADLALGLRFESDRIVDPSSGAHCGDPQLSGLSYSTSCRFRKALSLKDLQQPIREFHKAMVSCLAIQSPYPTWGAPDSSAKDACQNLSFNNALADVH